MFFRNNERVNKVKLLLFLKKGWVNFWWNKKKSYLCNALEKMRPLDSDYFA